MTENRKMIVFVNRLSTAVCLETELKRAFDGELEIACTMQKSGDKFKLKSPDKRNEILKDFSPKSHRKNSNKIYNLLICTDADGVGVNLQDADALVNYD